MACRLTAGISAPRHSGLFTTDRSRPPARVVQRPGPERTRLAGPGSGHPGSPYRSSAQRRWSARSSPKPRSSRHGPAISSARNRPTDRPVDPPHQLADQVPVRPGVSPATEPGGHSGSAAAQVGGEQRPVGDRGGRPGHRGRPAARRCASAPGGRGRCAELRPVLGDGGVRSSWPRSTSSNRQSAATGLPTE